MPGQPSDRPDQRADTASPPPSPLLDVIACDGADTTAVLVAAHSIRADVRVASSPDVWFDQLSRADTDPSYEPADVAVLVGGAERMVTQRWVARARSAAPDSLIAVALVDATLDLATSAVNQGARGLLILPSPGERVTYHLRDIAEAASRGQSQRRAVARHRRGVATLTIAEQDVLEGMLEGMANKQIALRLKIGLRTVELRRSKIMKKMRAKSLSQLISYICDAKQGCC